MKERSEAYAAIGEDGVGFRHSERGGVVSSDRHGGGRFEIVDSGRLGERHHLVIADHFGKANGSRIDGVRERLAHGYLTDAIFRIEIMRRVGLAVPIESAFGGIQHGELGIGFGGVSGDRGVDGCGVDEGLEDGPVGRLATRGRLARRYIRGRLRARALHRYGDRARLVRPAAEDRSDLGLRLWRSYPSRLGSCGFGLL